MKAVRVIKRSIIVFGIIVSCIIGSGIASNDFYDAYNSTMKNTEFVRIENLVIGISIGIMFDIIYIIILLIYDIKNKSVN